MKKIAAFWRNDAVQVFTLIVIFGLLAFGFGLKVSSSIQAEEQEAAQLTELQRENQELLKDKALLQKEVIRLEDQVNQLKAIQDQNRYTGRE